MVCSLRFGSCLRTDWYEHGVELGIVGHVAMFSFSYLFTASFDWLMEGIWNFSVKRVSDRSKHGSNTNIALLLLFGCGRSQLELCR